MISTYHVEIYLVELSMKQTPRTITDRVEKNGLVRLPRPLRSNREALLLKIMSLATFVLRP